MVDCILQGTINEPQGTINKPDMLSHTGHPLWLSGDEDQCSHTDMNFTRDLKNTVLNAYISGLGGVNYKLKQWSGTKLLLYCNWILDLSSDLSFCNFETIIKDNTCRIFSCHYSFLGFSEIPSLILWKSPHLHLYSWW